MRELAQKLRDIFQLPTTSKEKNKLLKDLAGILNTWRHEYGSLPQKKLAVDLPYVVDLIQAINALYDLHGQEYVARCKQADSELRAGAPPGQHDLLFSARMAKEKAAVIVRCAIAHMHRDLIPTAAAKRKMAIHHLYEKVEKDLIDEMDLASAARLKAPLKSPLKDATNKSRGEQATNAQARGDGDSAVGVAVQPKQPRQLGGRGRGAKLVTPRQSRQPVLLPTAELACYGNDGVASGGGGAAPDGTPDGMFDDSDADTSSSESAEDQEDSDDPTYSAADDDLGDSDDSNGGGPEQSLVAGAKASDGAMDVAEGNAVANAAAANNLLQQSPATSVQSWNMDPAERTKFSFELLQVYEGAKAGQRLAKARHTKDQIVQALELVMELIQDPDKLKEVMESEANMLEAMEDALELIEDPDQEDMSPAKRASVGLAGFGNSMSFSGGGVEETPDSRALQFAKKVVAQSGVSFTGMKPAGKGERDVREDLKDHWLSCFEQAKIDPPLLDVKAKISGHLKSLVSEACNVAVSGGQAEDLLGQGQQGARSSVGLLLVGRMIKLERKEIADQLEKDLEQQLKLSSEDLKSKPETMPCSSLSS